MSPKELFELVKSEDAKAVKPDSAHPMAAIYLEAYRKGDKAFIERDRMVEHLGPKIVDALKWVFISLGLVALTRMGVVPWYP